ncbi:tetratricopeptide repeat protein [Halopseudomonas pelagia]|uniref:tetratricopeptide repeat protein n=1 Tax=Halopseudomonas pelagia TaxID=553151 RepID=UPI0030D76A83|tara:strand:+ start:45330 stop:46610 length:1281 start_codon:yes stop_codon:yes gene_type:complete
MRFLPATLLTLAAVISSGCAGMPDKDQLWSRSSAFFTQSSDMIAAQSRRLADFAGGLVGSNDQALLQQEVDELFAQPYIDPLTLYIEEHSADDRRAKQLALVAQERDQRCGGIAQTYAKRDATQDHLQRMQRGYLRSCPEDVQDFAARVTQSRVTPSAVAQSPAAAQVRSEPAPAIAADFSAAVDEAVSRRQNSNCYLLFTIKNYTQAHSACRPIADSGDAKAQHHMASLERTRGDFPAAFAWAGRSAGQQHAPGQLVLGQLYQAGQGTAVDKTKALQLMRQAANQGLTEASYYTGLAYKDGAGVSQSVSQADKYLKQAASQGHMPAHLALASLYEQRQPDTARHWLNQAARKGSAEAQLKLANDYANSASNTSDQEEAYVWYSLALLNGNSQAKAGIERQEKLLSEDQLATARSRIQDGINGKWN